MLHNLIALHRSPAVMVARKTCCQTNSIDSIIASLRHPFQKPSDTYTVTHFIQHCMQRTLHACRKRHALMQYRIHVLCTLRIVSTGVATKVWKCVQYFNCVCTASVSLTFLKWCICRSSLTIAIKPRRTIPRSYSDTCWLKACWWMSNYTHYLREYLL